MHIDVMIPTYNRRDYVHYQVASLNALRLRLQPHGIKLRLVISDNLSEKPVISQPYWNEFVKVVRPERHLPTAEENLRFGLQHCSGDYVWVLGDDDSPVIENCIETFRSIEKSRPALAICNSSGSLVDGEFRATRTVCSEPGQIHGLPDFIERTGFWFVVAGISCLIFDRKIALDSIAKFDDYFSISPIYSHVFWVIDVFWNEKFEFFEAPQVIYKQNATDVRGEVHWQSVAKKLGWFHRFPWTVGFVRHARHLRHSRAVPSGFFSNVIDQNFEFRFHHLSVAIHHFLLELEDQFSGKSAARKISDEEKMEFLDFVSAEDPKFLEILAPLRSAGAALADIVLAKHFLFRFIDRHFYRHFFRTAYVGWNIYFFDRFFQAVPQGTEEFMFGGLRDIAPINSKRVILGKRLEDVKLEILKAPYPEHDRLLEWLKKRDQMRDLQFIRSRGFWPRVLRKIKSRLRLR